MISANIESGQLEIGFYDKSSPFSCSLLIIYIYIYMMHCIANLGPNRTVDLCIYKTHYTGYVIWFLKFQNFCNFSVVYATEHQNGFLKFI